MPGTSPVTQNRFKYTRNKRYLGLRLFQKSKTQSVGWRLEGQDSLPSCPTSDSLAQRSWQGGRAWKRSQGRRSGGSSTPAANFDPWLRGYPPGTALLKHQPSDIFLTRFPSTFRSSWSLGFRNTPWPSSLIPTSKPHLVQPWKYSLGGSPITLCENAFPPFKIFPSGYSLSWSSKERFCLKK